jgi:hypothetical protein
MSPFGSRSPTYALLARPIGPVRIGAIQSLLVRDRSQSPEVGDRAAPASSVAREGAVSARELESAVNRFLR